MKSAAYILNESTIIAEPLLRVFVNLCGRISKLSFGAWLDFLNTFGRCSIVTQPGYSLVPCCST